MDIFGRKKLMLHEYNTIFVEKFILNVHTYYLHMLLFFQCFFKIYNFVYNSISMTL